MPSRAAGSVEGVWHETSTRALGRGVCDPRMEAGKMVMVLRRGVEYVRMRLRGPAPLLLLAGLNAGSAFGSLTFPSAPLDMDVFRASGRALIAGESPYQVTGVNNLNAPASLLFFHAAAVALGDLWTPAAWYFASLAAYLMSLLILARHYPSPAGPTRPATAMAPYALWITIRYRELYTFLVLLLAVAYWATIRERVLVAAAFGGLLVAFKPNFAVWPALILLSGHRRLGVALSIGAALWCLLAAIIYGPGPYIEWLSIIRALLPLELSYPHNSSLQSIAYRLGFAWAGPVLSGFVLAGVAAWAWRVRPDPPRAVPVALLAGILASPISMPGYACFLVPGFLSRPWNRPMWIAAGLLLVPLWLREFLGFDFQILWAALVTAVYSGAAVGFFLPVRRSPG